MPVINTIEKAREIIGRIFNGATHLEYEGRFLKGYLPKMGKEDAEEILNTLVEALRDKPHQTIAITLKFQNSDIDPRGLYFDCVHWSKYEMDNPLNAGRIGINPQTHKLTFEFHTIAAGR